jgi:flagellar biosynthesis regulator FlaF
MCRMIQVDKTTYKAIMKASQDRLKAILRCGLKDMILEKARQKEEWANIEACYMKQQIWKKIATTASKGMRDHGSDFSKSELESLPNLNSNPNLKN